MNEQHTIESQHQAILGLEQTISARDADIARLELALRGRQEEVGRLNDEIARRDALAAAPATEQAKPELAGLTALTAMCDQIDAMQRTMFRRPGTGQNYSYLVHEDVAAYVEQARAILAAQPVPQASSESRAAAMCDLQYDAGARAGFMAGERGDTSFITKLDQRVAGAVGVLKSAVPVPQASGERDAGIEVAAAFVGKMASDYIRDHASIDPDTGSVEFHARERGREYHSVLDELADELRTLKSSAATTSKPEGGVA